MSRHVVEARGWCLGDALKCYFYRLRDNKMLHAFYAMLCWGCYVVVGVTCYICMTPVARRTNTTSLRVLRSERARRSHLASTRSIERGSANAASSS